MGTHENNSELKHYGVLGMRWGVRKDRRYIGSEQRTRNAASAGERARGSAMSKSLSEKPRSLARASVVADAAMVKGQAKSFRNDHTYNRGLKYEQKLNRMTTRNDKAADRYRRNASEYSRTDAIAKKYMTSDKYSKWSQSLVRNLYGKKVSSLQNKAAASREKVDRYIDKLSKKYTLAYDGSTKYYTLKVRG